MQLLEATEVYNNRLLLMPLDIVCTFVSGHLGDDHAMCTCVYHENVSIHVCMFKQHACYEMSNVSIHVY